MGLHTYKRIGQKYKKNNFIFIKFMISNWFITFKSFRKHEFYKNEIIFLVFLSDSLIHV